MTARGGGAAGRALLAQPDHLLDDLDHVRRRVPDDAASRQLVQQGPVLHPDPQPGPEVHHRRLRAERDAGPQSAHARELAQPFGHRARRRRGQDGRGRLRQRDREVDGLAGHRARAEPAAGGVDAPASAGLLGQRVHEHQPAAAAGVGGGLPGDQRRGARGAGGAGPPPGSGVEHLEGELGKGVAAEIRPHLGPVPVTVHDGVGGQLGDDRLRVAHDGRGHVQFGEHRPGDGARERRRRRPGR